MWGKQCFNKLNCGIQCIYTYQGEGNGTPLQYSCLENPMGRGAWWAAIRGVAKSRTRLSDFIFTFPFHALEKEMATHSRVLAWRIPGTGEPGGLPSMGSHRVGHDWSDLAAAHISNHHTVCLKHLRYYMSLYLNNSGQKKERDVLFLGGLSSSNPWVDNLGIYYLLCIHMNWT